MAYCTVCPVVVVSAFTVMEFSVGVPFTVGAFTADPSPIATALAVIVPDTATAAVAPVTLPCATVEGAVMFGAVVEAVVGAPDILMVTVVAFVRDAVAAVNPAGNPDTVKFVDVIVDA